MLKEKRKQETKEELSFRSLIRDIYTSSKRANTLVVVNKIHPMDVLFRNFSVVMEMQMKKGLLEIKTYDSLSVSDFNKEIFEL